MFLSQYGVAFHLIVAVFLQCQIAAILAVHLFFKVKKFAKVNYGVEDRRKGGMDGVRVGGREKIYGGTDRGGGRVDGGVDRRVDRRVDGRVNGKEKRKVDGRVFSKLNGKRERMEDGKMWISMKEVEFNKLSQRCGKLDGLSKGLMKKKTTKMSDKSKKVHEGWEGVKRILRFKRKGMVVENVVVNERICQKLSRHFESSPRLKHKKQQPIHPNNNNLPPQTTITHSPKQQQPTHPNNNNPPTQKKSYQLKQQQR